MRSLVAIQHNMCVRKVAIDYTAPMPVRYVDAARGCDMYLCPFCGFAHFTSKGHKNKEMRRTRRFVERHLESVR